MTIQLEHVEALAAAGCTVEQIVALFRADRTRTLRLRAEREARRGLQPFNLNNPVKVAGVESGSTGLQIAVSAQQFASGGYKKDIARMGVLGSLDLRQAAKLVMAVLLEHHNMKTGRCDPSLGLIASKTGLSERSVRRAVVELEGARILLRRVHGGRYHANQFDLDWAQLQALAAENPIMNKADSAPANRTIVAAEPDARVRQNESQKQFSSVVVARSRARPDPSQKEFLYPLPGQRRVAEQSALARLQLALAAHLGRFGPRFAARARAELGAETITKAVEAELIQKGSGWPLILEALGPGGPPSQSVRTG